MQVEIEGVLRAAADSMGMKCTKIVSGMTEMPVFDDGIYSVFFDRESWNAIPSVFPERFSEGNVYHVEGPLRTEFTVLPVPAQKEEADSMFILGPYSLFPQRPEEMMVKGVDMGLSGAALDQWCDGMKKLPVIGDISQWHRLCLSLAALMYPGRQEPLTECARQTFFSEEPPLFDDNMAVHLTINDGMTVYPSSNDDNVVRLTIKARMENEDRMLRAVSTGDADEAVRIWQKWCMEVPKEIIAGRSEEDNQRFVNYYSNFFSRLAEKKGISWEKVRNVRVSLRESARSIRGWEETRYFISEMIRRYCRLIQENSLTGCSPVIRRAVGYIDTNLNQDLSLSSVSRELSINSSYLSTLFKKEMNGVTLTDYVRSRRAEYAQWLMNNTDMELSDIAEACGIDNVNYFRRVFKKATGTTPTEYRKRRG